MLTAATAVVVAVAVAVAVAIAIAIDVDVAIAVAVMVVVVVAAVVFTVPLRVRSAAVVGLLSCVSQAATSTAGQLQPSWPGSDPCSSRTWSATSARVRTIVATTPPLGLGLQAVRLVVRQ